MIPAKHHEALMADPTTCKHSRTQLIAKDQDAEYVECLECGAILEAGEVDELSGFDESLSDA
jgi:transcription initiation factor TFIIIB Brf1 subunit/transcription initiation factor TFIIB